MDGGEVFKDAISTIVMGQEKPLHIAALLYLSEIFALETIMVRSIIHHLLL
jgi:hypothetical protein